jgi:hypothetical protein
MREAKKVEKIALILMKKFPGLTAISATEIAYDIVEALDGN